MAIKNNKKEIEINFIGTNMNSKMLLNLKQLTKYSRTENHRTIIMD